MRIGLRPHPRFLLASVLAPHLRKAKEVPLLRRVPVPFSVDIPRQSRRRILRNRLLQRLERNPDAAVVRRILAQRQSPIQILPRRHRESRILVRNALGPLVELLQIVRREPVLARCRSGRTSRPGRRRRASSRARSPRRCPQSSPLGRSCRHKTAAAESQPGN